ncbi:SDR family NAD(P)-dependent oxidoreductase [Nocardia sp. NPDC057663]|uniref:SDR family NAD(P)-dependent oxidoreductase n=1 Tax=Nocardia sp. NPDC057663 TaxID=3346201 RepID=UPI0036723E8F
MNGPVLITGSSSGLGLATAKVLAGNGIPTILACRDASRAAAAKQQISAVAPQAEVEIVIVDLASIDSVHQAATEMAARELTPSAIICNAGLQIVDGVESSTDGYEMTFATNHLGHFQLVGELLDALEPGARVVVVSSDVHQGPGKSGGFPAPEWAAPGILADAERQRRRPSSRDGRVRYATSKLANVYFAYELARRVEQRGITVNAFDPGLMPETQLSRNYPTVMRRGFQLMAPLIRLMVPVARPLAQSADDLAWLATAPELAECTGSYFTGRNKVPSAPESYDADRARELWTASELLVQKR